MRLISPGNWRIRLGACILALGVALYIPWMLINLNTGARTAALSSLISFGSSVIDWTALPVPASSAPRGIVIDSNSSTIRFPNLTHLNAAYTDNNASVSSILGLGTSGSTNSLGNLDLPSLTRLSAPAQRGDYFQFIIQGGFNAPVLSQIDGNTKWVAAANVSLPAMTTMSNAYVQVQAGSTFSLPAATALSNVQIDVQGAPGGFSAPGATAFSWAAPAGNPSSPPAVIAIAQSAGTVNLSGLRTMDFSQDLSGARFDVRLGSTLDLSGLTSIAGPSRLAFPTYVPMGYSNRGVFNFGSLETVNGNVMFQVGTAASAGAMLPALKTLRGGQLVIDAGGVFESSKLAVVDDALLNASNAGAAIRLPSVTALSSVGRGTRPWRWSRRTTGA